MIGHNKTAAKRLRMRRVEHFRSRFPVKVSHAYFVSVACILLVCFMLSFGCFETAFMDDQEKISRLDSEKV